MQYVDVARAVTARGEVVLRARSDPDHADPTATVLELRVNGVFVMDTASVSTEQSLAAVALAEHGSPRSVLVGGLGLGFTTGTVLADSRVERVSVVEIEAPVIDWMHDGTIPSGPDLLADERLAIVEGDIGQMLATAAPSTYDLVLLDIDNGPDNLVHDDNAALYSTETLQRIRRCLRPEGLTVIWSSTATATLHAAMRQVFGQATELPFDVVMQGRDELHWLYLARVPAVLQ